MIMKQLKYLMFFVICMFISILSIQSVVEAAEFDIKAGDVQAWIEEDGDVKFRQIYTYDVDEMNGALINILTSGHEFYDYSAGIIDSSTHEPLVFKESKNGADNTFELLATTNAYQFKIYHPTEDDMVQFFVEYSLKGVVENYLDTAVFNWKLIGTGIDDNLDVTAKVYLPGKIESSEHFRAWGHGSPQGRVYPKKESNPAFVEIEVPNNQPQRFVELMTLFPTRLTAKNPNKQAIEKLDELTKQEDQRVLQDQEQHKKDAFLAFGILGVFASIGCVCVMASYLTYRYKLHEINPNPAHVPKHVYQPPVRIPSAVAAYTYFRDGVGQSSGDLSATLLDLTRRGYLSLEPVDQSWGRQSVRINQLKEKDESFTKFEHAAYDFVRPYRGQAIVLSEIHEFMKESKKYKNVQKQHIESFTKALIESVKDELDTKIFGGRFALMIFGAIMTLVLTFVFFVLSTIFYVHWGFKVGVIVYAIVNIIIAIKFFNDYDKHPLLNYEDDKKRQEWKSFARMLKDIGQMNLREIAELPLWEEYLVYAFAFGYAKKVIKAMKLQFDASDFENSAFPTFMYADNGAFVTMFNESLTDTVTSQSDFGSTGYAGDNLGGGGGGFSSGSSGGGGGGGAGGF